MNNVIFQVPGILLLLGGVALLVFWALKEMGKKLSQEMDQPKFGTVYVILSFLFLVIGLTAFARFIVLLLFFLVLPFRPFQ